MKIRNLTLRSGDLAYADTFSGLIPCKVLSIRDVNSVSIKLTAGRGPYRKGEVLTWDWKWVVPRDAALFRRNCSTRILGYNVECDA